MTNCIREREKVASPEGMAGILRVDGVTFCGDRIQSLCLTGKLSQTVKTGSTAPDTTGAAAHGGYYSTAPSQPDDSSLLWLGTCFAWPVLHFKVVLSSSLLLLFLSLLL